MGMAKELGQIHTLNFRVEDIQRDDDIAILDLSGELSKQLQHQVRQGNYFKVVGIDMTLTDFGTGDGGGQASGFLEYYSPTRGRCKAYRDAFAAMRNAMKLQGISMTTNPNYDFRVSWKQETSLTVNNQVPLGNCATLDGTNDLVFYGGTGASDEIFTVHNQSVTPVNTGTPSFQTGFNTMGVQSTPTDFVNDEQDLGYTGNPMYANPNAEAIPWQLSYSPGTTDISTSLQWRPDPALYVAMAFGQIRVKLDEIDLDGAQNPLNLDIAVHIAGWKSIMGDPDKPKRVRSKAKPKMLTESKTVTTTKKSS